jgi:nitrogen fixation/metabolism regulation signal transduction histidine kinase
VLIAVVNLFVLLFALSVLVAVFISNWTTRPLDLLKNALSRVALQGANEPIRYRGDDEVGQLVEVYNRKVEELHASAERLARSERESAWREMARQVAHEIKNPLTPMKLGIQHFQRTWSPEAPDAAERLERFSKAMVEQIDALSNIAGEFSNFAQMPRTQEEDLDLADVVDAALALIGALDKHFTLERTPGETLPIRADREQLLRVFNNLLKNAEQSIPEGRVHHRGAAAHGRTGHRGGARQRQWHRRGGQGTHLPAQLHHQEQRHGTGPRHGATHRGGRRWQGMVRDPGGTRHDILRGLAPAEVADTFDRVTPGPLSEVEVPGADQSPY